MGVTLAPLLDATVSKWVKRFEITSSGNVGMLISLTTYAHLSTQQPPYGSLFKLKHMIK